MIFFLYCKYCNAKIAWINLTNITYQTYEVLGRPAFSDNIDLANSNVLAGVSSRSTNISELNIYTKSRSTVHTTNKWIAIEQIKTSVATFTNMV